ncbi:twin-arginine translocation pathway signal [Pseudomonas syringae]|nr:twin-arginine translocation pathway signal [Pseudomonas syringae]MBD8577301.1 twin-arginine translocation pathway signal [Pseudomonas syringae]MBD8793125.1 twin-arginine translocation pathway signal [Pseudomonas syringae]MBD8802902.1 twin-arginine translocation pathway signal [Pseudomonas syringae]MBD8813614.1 twin-arginine translocation pathway signal [Pseudomonas syringae]
MSLVARVIRTLRPCLLAGALLALPGLAPQAASQVITGQDGWLFPGWESLDSVDNAGMARNVTLLKDLQRQLERQHITLVMLIVPMKAPLYRKRLEPHQTISPAVLQRYERIQAQLAQAGLGTLDLKPVLQQTEHGDRQAFWRADYHWTAWAAEDAAQATADLISRRYRLEGEPGGGTALGPWVQKRMFGDLAANLLPAVKRKLIGRDVYTVRREVEKDLLIDDAPAPVHVIGNSFVQPFLGFPQKLSNALDRPVTLTWNPGDVGPWATFMQYLESPDFAGHKPQVIVLQFNEGQFHLGPDAPQWNAKGVTSLSQWQQRLRKVL